jgi:LacI family transcriptional regulator
MEDNSGNRLQSHRRKSAKLSDVACRAGVSTATVSRAINDPGKVRPEMLARVQTAIAELGYVPHGAARALALQRSLTIGTIIPTFQNAIFVRGLEALERRLIDAGYTLLLASSGYDLERELEAARKLMERGIDGLMLIGEDHHPALYDLLAAKGLPFVNTWVYRPESPYPSIGFDNRVAAFRMASHLIDMGHRRIGMIAGISKDNDRAAMRIVGVRDALDKHGLSLPPAHFIEQPYGIAEGKQGLRLLMDSAAPPTAIICGNDVLGFGALFEARALGMNVPQDISITGFDDLNLARHMEPALTTMRVPSAEMGRRAADYLFARLSGETPPAATELEVSLIVRGTTAPPREL